MISKGMFTGDGARFQVENGFGQIVKARDIADCGRKFCGLGVYHELLREHEWLHLFCISRRADGRISLEYLFLDEPRASGEPDSKVERGEGLIRTTQSVKTRIDLLCGSVDLDPDDDVLLSIEPVERPQGKQTTVTTIREEATWTCTLPPQMVDETSWRFKARNG